MGTVRQLIKANCHSTTTSAVAVLQLVSNCNTILKTSEIFTGFFVLYCHFCPAVCLSCWKHPTPSLSRPIVLSTHIFCHCEERSNPYREWLRRDCFPDTSGQAVPRKDNWVFFIVCMFHRVSPYAIFFALIIGFHPMLC